MTLKRALLAVALIYEAYWAYLFFTAPVPDVGMQSVAAILFGVILPLLVIGPIVMVRVFR